MQKEKKSQGRSITADFLTYTLRALAIGLATALALGAGVLFLAQSSGQDEADEQPAIQSKQ
jgi:hypothetical protein